MAISPAPPPPGLPHQPTLPGRLLWSEAKLLTLAAAMALGLFAQIGLAVHLFSLLVPALGATGAGLAMGLVTAMARPAAH